MYVLNMANIYSVVKKRQIYVLFLLIPFCSHLVSYENVCAFSSPFLERELPNANFIKNSNPDFDCGGVDYTYYPILSSLFLVDFWPPLVGSLAFFE